ncbi:2112_t:CDS:2 [Funneliformis geosporum]|uniref:2112_t:CDS:1 n=1 Tax=Funneliformis geosporum TaxID=1117311 RepID=A0A9W4WT69_9GLOM|nr:2112_t:CDS:2 [Funneliformis geosporum]
MQAEKRQPYLGSKQALRDYTTTYFDRVYNYLRILPNEPMPSSFPLLPSECCFRCKTPYIINSILWCRECEIRLFIENFGNWTSGIVGLDEFIKRTQLTTSCEGGWMNEMEKHHDEFIWKLVYEEAPSYVREFGVQKIQDNTQNLSSIKKKSDGWTKVVKKFGLRHKKRLSPSQPTELKLWCDRVLARIEIEITKGNFSCDKNTTGSQYVALKQLKNSKNFGIEFVHQDIHDQGFAHLGIHDGNILLNLSKSFLEEESECSLNHDILISDFGMYTPENEFSNSSSHQKNYGLIPYTAPEILFNSNNDELYTAASDIYSFAMIMWELTSGQPPFVHLAHDEDLIGKIIDGEDESHSILFDPNGPYTNSPRYKRALAPKVTDLNDLTKLEKNVFINPYASMIGGPIRQCIYHQRWFPKDFLVRFIRAYDDETSSVWIVPDFMEEGGTKRPGKGNWIRCNAKTLLNVLKEGKYKMIDNQAYWRKDMQEHIWKILVEDSILRFDRIIDRLGTHRFPMKKESAFHPVIKAENSNRFESYTKPILGLNCKKKSKKKSDDSYIPLKILPNHIGSIEKVSYISHKDDISDKFDDVNFVTRNIPFYYVKTIWGDEGIEKIKNYLNLSQRHSMIGVVSASQTKQLAISLWKLRNYWQ